MTGPLTDKTAITRALPAEDSARFLVRALTQRVGISLQLEGEGHDAIWEGTLVGGDASSLSVQLPGNMVVVRGLLPYCLLQATFEIDDSCFVFETRPMESASTDRDVLRMTRPATIELVERRRARRRRLQPHGEVELIATGIRKKWRQTATMLNVCEQGLACRVDNCELGALAVGQSLRVSFQLGRGQKPFDLPARVANITGGATQEQSVIGVEFVNGARTKAEWNRLRVTLRATN